MLTCVHMISHPGRLIHPERQISADGKWKEMRVHQEERKAEILSWNLSAKVTYRDPGHPSQHIPKVVRLNWGIL